MTPDDFDVIDNGSTLSTQKGRWISYSGMDTFLSDLSCYFNHRAHKSIDIQIKILKQMRELPELLVNFGNQQSKDVMEALFKKYSAADEWELLLRHSEGDEYTTFKSSKAYIIKFSHIKRAHKRNEKESAIILNGGTDGLKERLILPGDRDYAFDGISVDVVPDGVVYALATPSITLKDGHIISLNWCVKSPNDIDLSRENRDELVENIQQRLAL